MAKNWNVGSVTGMAVANNEARLATEREEIILGRLKALRAIQESILAEISTKNNTDTNQNLQSAMECINMAIVEIQVTEKRLSGE